ncbi:MAG: hypothetical protein ACXAC6_17695 [Candidatus Hodarchaeales archaeon]|jgi:transcription elongation GreA/GreB family factor
MSKSAKYAYLEHLEEQAEIKARERYWEKIFANAPLRLVEEKRRKNLQT